MVGDPFRNVVGLAPHPTRATLDLGARLLAGARREQQGDARADEDAEQQVADAAAVLLDDDVRVVVVVVTLSTGETLLRKLLSPLYVAVT